MAVAYSMAPCMIPQSPYDQVNLPVDLKARINRGIAYFEALHSRYSHELESFIQSKARLSLQKKTLPRPCYNFMLLITKSLICRASALRMPIPLGEVFMPQIQRMIMIGQKIVSYILSDSSCGESAVSYNVDMGFVTPLYNLARHCKDPIIRQQVIDLLRSVKRQEGLWNSLLVAKALEQIVEIEESDWNDSSVYADHEREARYLSVNPILELDSRGRLKYTRQEQEFNEQIKVVEEIFSW